MFFSASITENEAVIPKSGAISQLKVHVHNDDAAADSLVKASAKLLPRW